MHTVSEIVLKWNKRFMTQKEDIFDTRGITTELCHCSIFLLCVCVCVLKWDKRLMKQKEFIFNTRRIYTELCQGNVCVCVCVCVCARTFLCGGGVRVRAHVVW